MDICFAQFYILASFYEILQGFSSAIQFYLKTNSRYYFSLIIPTLEVIWTAKLKAKWRPHSCSYPPMFSNFGFCKLGFIYIFTLFLRWQIFFWNLFSIDKIWKWRIEHMDSIQVLYQDIYVSTSNKKSTQRIAQSNFLTVNSRRFSTLIGNWILNDNLHQSRIVRIVLIT